MSKGDKYITLLCSLSDFYDNLVMMISSTTTITLKFDDAVASLLLKETRLKYFENHLKEELVMKG